MRNSRLFNYITALVDEVEVIEYEELNNGLFEKKKTIVEVPHGFANGNVVKTKKVRYKIDMKTIRDFADKVSEEVVTDE